MTLRGVHSCCMQLELREKMTLIQGKEQYAISDRFDFGSTFGGGGGYGNDLKIADECTKTATVLPIFLSPTILDLNPRGVNRVILFSAERRMVIVLE